MTNKDFVLSAIKNHNVKPIVTALENEYIVDDRFLLEMDRDGAFAAIISPLVSNGRTYNETRKLIVFNRRDENHQDKMLKEIHDSIMQAVETL